MQRIEEDRKCFKAKRVLQEGVAGCLERTPRAILMVQTSNSLNRVSGITGSRDSNHIEGASLNPQRFQCVTKRLLLTRRSKGLEILAFPTLSQHCPQTHFVSGDFWLKSKKRSPTIYRSFELNAIERVENF